MRHAGDVLPGDAPPDLSSASAPLDERYEVGLLEDDDYADRARRGRLRAALRRGRRRPPLRRGLLRASSSPTASTARILAANQQRYAEKWGQPWQPYGRRPNPRYEREAEQLREAVCATVPADATVLVVSRGDEALLELERPRAPSTSRRPRTAAGRATIPPTARRRSATSRRCASSGAELLVVPPTYRWWLSHYEGLREHLEARYRAVVSDERAGAIFLLEEEARR